MKIDHEYPADWNRRRENVKKRDNYTCQNCGDKGGEYGSAQLHAHHIVPKSKGGTHDKNNLTTVCDGCHGAIHYDKLAPTAFADSPDQSQSTEDGLWALKLGLWLVKLWLVVVIALPTILYGYLFGLASIGFFLLALLATVGLLYDAVIVGTPTSVWTLASDIVTFALLPLGLPLVTMVVSGIGKVTWNWCLHGEPTATLGEGKLFRDGYPQRLAFVTLSPYTFVLGKGWALSPSSNEATDDDATEADASV